ncbi:uncharacterized protein GGS22DRAFT_155666 [Annulohypoxylon maeteangense]|uniref:uncharacterized protein n=1 Tax=Annulohypoxylon maeteangense TaxID=1927788 RepID=UPI002007DC2B|nr:uncharacterized protein GGS22DRAFT_155666 [Annulohypoxylon maeteangense]KAI0888357.1 hypothetical protein GGS22DRAFT_155666 [Annulohypoxylon maeteangense]
MNSLLLHPAILTMLTGRYIVEESLSKSLWYPSHGIFMWKELWLKSILLWKNACFSADMSFRNMALRTTLRLSSYDVY